jgi:hypothetical protein
VLQVNPSIIWSDRSGLVMGGLRLCQWARKSTHLLCTKLTRSGDGEGEEDEEEACSECSLPAADAATAMAICALRAAVSVGAQGCTTQEQLNMARRELAAGISVAMSDEAGGSYP